MGKKNKNSNKNSSNKSRDAWTDDAPQGAFNNPFAALASPAQKISKKSEDTSSIKSKSASPATPAPRAEKNAKLAPAASSQPHDPVSASAPEAASTTPRRAVIRLTRKGRGGKSVTLISHLEGLDGPGRERLCAELRRALGCGGALEDDAIALHGDQRERARQRLEALGVKRLSVS